MFPYSMIFNTICSAIIGGLVVYLFHNVKIRYKNFHSISKENMPDTSIAMIQDTSEEMILNTTTNDQTAINTTDSNESAEMKSSINDSNENTEMKNFNILTDQANNENNELTNEGVPLLAEKTAQWYEWEVVPDPSDSH